MIEAVAWGLGTGISVWAISSAVKSVYGRKYCDVHTDFDKIMKEWSNFSSKLNITLSEVTAIKQASIDLAVFVCEHFVGNGAEQEARDLRDKIITEMMKRRS